MKKWFVCLMALVLALALSGCMGAARTTETLASMPAEEEPWSQEDAPDPAGYSHDLTGLCSFMEAAGVVAGGDAYPIETNYELLGAVGGQRYRFSFNGGSVQVEFYEFDPDALSQDAQTFLADAQVQGRITVLRDNVPAAASADNRFMMLYIDGKTDDRNIAHREKAETCFSLFCGD